jgi:DNA ligase-1
VPPATLIDFARVNDAAAATTKKLQKQAVLADYFRALDEQDLRRAVRFCGGRAFASTDERVLNVGGALVSDVVLSSVLHISANEYWEVVTRSGEIGNALAELWPRRAVPAPTGAAPLTLAEIADGFDDLAATGAWENKSDLLRTLFARCIDAREPAYLAKIIFGDLRTGVQEGVLQAAIALAFGKPLADVQRCQLLVGDLDEVAVLARNDALDAARFRLFHPIQFMLATPQETAEEAAITLDGRTFYAEDKLDGIRAQVHKSGGTGHAARVHVYTRTMDRQDESFPEVVEAVAQLPGEFLLDGEIVPYRDGVVLPFGHIQKRLGRKVLTPKILRENPAAFIAFDVLYRDGELLMDCPLRVRRETLLALCGGEERSGDGNGQIKGCAPKLLFSQVTQVSTAQEIAAHFQAARDRRNEGTMLKDPESCYSPGRRGKMWLKIKTHLPTFDCVVTAAEYGHGKRRNSLSDYTFAVWDREPGEEGAQLVNVGKAYSGVTDVEIAQLTELFHTISLKRFGHVHLVRPQVVLEIACDQIQKSNRHASGYALRFPRIKRVRWDKRPEDADRLTRIVEIYESTANTARQKEAEPAPVRREPTLFD